MKSKAPLDKAQATAETAVDLHFRMNRNFSISEER